MSGQQNAVVLVSGGLDSATTLAMARDEGFACHALSFDYGQRNRRELEAAKQVGQSMGVVEHKVMAIDLRAFGGSALTDEIEVPKSDGSQSGGAITPNPSPTPGQGRGGSAIPITYVPARNTIFLSLALGYAEVLGALDIFIGVNAVDYSGYPDCRPAFIEAFEKTANLATRIGVEGGGIRVRAPLIDLTKSEIIRRGIALGVDYGLTLSCYDPSRENERGACGRCDACVIRAAGFAEAGIDDPAC